MLGHKWPGNVRELENAVERAVILAESGKKIGPELLGLESLSMASVKASNHARKVVPSKSADPDADFDEGDLPSMEEVEKRHILKALDVTEGNRTKAAALLSINVRTLRNKIRQYKLEGEAVPG